MTGGNMANQCRSINTV